VCIAAGSWVLEDTMRDSAFFSVTWHAAWTGSLRRAIEEVENLNKKHFLTLHLEII
jgi:hypothetical protein